MEARSPRSETELRGKTPIMGGKKPKTLKIEEEEESSRENSVKNTVSVLLLNSNSGFWPSAAPNVINTFVGWVIDFQSLYLQK